ncbi:MAG: hypothetical protein WA113_08570 [Desulfitobacteriaceae bacterium]
MEKDGDNIPEPSEPPFEDMPKGAMIVPITVFPDIVKNEMDNRAVKTNITLPAWLKELAEKQGVNFSQIAQAGLREYLETEKQ